MEFLLILMMTYMLNNLIQTWYSGKLTYELECIIEELHIIQSMFPLDTCCNLKSHPDLFLNIKHNHKIHSYFFLLGNTEIKLTTKEN